MATTPTDAADIERLVNRGPRNFWYPLAPSWMVHRAPVGLTRLSERIVLWRDADGTPHALEDRCPHRGARLSLGWNLGGSVACWYHGIEIAADGTVLRVPAQQSCPLEGERAVKSYAVAERNGAVFAWFGDALHPEPTQLDLPEELTSDDWSQFLCTAHWKCNYRYALENVMDPMHGAYLHASSHSMAMGDKTAVMRIVGTDGGFLFEKVGQRGVNFDWVEWGESGLPWMRLAIPYRKDAGPGGSFTIIGSVTPVDEHNCRVFFWRCRKVQGWQRDAWRFFYRNRLEGLHWDVLEQDRVILEAMADDAREHEFLYQHDTGLSRVRRRLKQIAEQQVAALAAANRGTMIGLSGKRILVTGAARGLGRSFAAAIARAGARVVLADRLEDEGRAAATEIAAHFVKIDLADPVSIDGALAAAVGHLGGLDGLVNNAAIATGIGGKGFEEIDLATWDAVMSVNIRGTWLVTRAAAPHLRRSGAGRIVNLASDTALWGAPKLLHYVASKGAVIAMTRSLARELGPDGIAVNAIAPGLTIVEATDYVPEERHRLYVENRAMPRRQMPEDVVGAVLFLLSDEAGFVTGQLLPVNGGFVMN